MVSSSNSNQESPSDSSHFSNNNKQGETSTSSISTSSSSLNTQPNPPRQSIDHKYIPINKQQGLPSTSTQPPLSDPKTPISPVETQPQEKETEEPNTCLEKYMDTPFSGVWYHDLGDKLHPILGYPLLIICCPIAMPCMLLTACLLISDGSQDEEEEDAYATMRKMRKESAPQETPLQ